MLRPKMPAVRFASGRQRPRSTGSRSATADIVVGMNGCTGNGNAYDSTISLLRQSPHGGPSELMRAFRFWRGVARWAVCTALDRYSKKIYRFAETSGAATGSDGSTVRYSPWDGTVVIW